MTGSKSNIFRRVAADWNVSLASCWAIWCDLNLGKVKGHKGHCKRARKLAKAAAEDFCWFHLHAKIMFCESFGTSAISSEERSKMKVFNHQFGKRNSV